MRVFSILGLAAASSACGFSPGGGNPQSVDAQEIDARPIDAPDALDMTCFQEGLIDVCFDGRPDAITLTADIDTDDAAHCEANGGIHNVAITNTPACVLIGETISLGANMTIRAHGSKPLVLVARTTIEIAGTLDVSSTVGGGRVGAGANDTTTCHRGVDPADGAENGTDFGGGAGGAGGSFGEKGADGGDGDNNGATLRAHGAAGDVPDSIAQVQGGCKAQDGGDNDGTGNNDGVGGAGGASGGAVYLAATEIDIDGSIFASGAGGKGGKNSAGGGGGGSGGLVGLQATTIRIAGGATIAANGGGGGGGAQSGSGTTGNTADDGHTANDYNMPAAGGTASGDQAGNGGAGASRASIMPVAGGTNNAGGGGGGGGVGIVWVKTGSDISAARISPAPQNH